MAKFRVEVKRGKKRDKCKRVFALKEKVWVVRGWLYFKKRIRKVIIIFRDRFVLKRVRPFMGAAIIRVR